MSRWDKFGIPKTVPKYYTIATPQRLAAVGGHRVVGQGRRGATAKPAEVPDAPMLAYIVKRLLLMIPTLLGVLTVTFVIIQFVPGGPVEQLLAEARAGARRRDAGGYAARRDLDAKQIEELKKLYGFDKPPLERYFAMLEELRAVRPRQELPAQQGRVAADQGEAAGVDQPRAVDVPALLPDLDSARRRQGGARGHALRHG